MNLVPARFASSFPKLAAPFALGLLVTACGADGLKTFEVGLSEVAAAGLMGSIQAM